MQHPSLVGAIAHLGPCLAFEYSPRFYGLVDQFGALGKDPSRAKSIVPHFGITHIVVRWHTHRGPMGL